jgi:hypothetical protein
VFVLYRRRLGLREQLATYHFLSGMAGILISLWFAPALLANVRADQDTTARLLIFAMLAAFGAVMAVGVGLFGEGHRVFFGAAFVQLLQIPVVSAPRLRWDFFSGGYLVPYWVFGKGWAGAVGVKAAVDVGWRPPPPFYVGLNLVPFVVLWLLYRCWRGKAPGINSESAANQIAGEPIEAPAGLPSITNES